MKPFLEPVQRLLLGLLLPLRALRALSNGRADPVATATLAAACLAVGLGKKSGCTFLRCTFLQIVHCSCRV